MRALITAPLPGPTPYSGGLFAFDIYVPDTYPKLSPLVKLLTTGGGKVRFGPNLYADGTVCLSLLGTWIGPEWDPEKSSLHQILISIQGMILGVEHPWYLEPGYGGWEDRGVPGNNAHLSRVTLYEDSLRVATVQYAMAQPLRWSLENTSKSEMIKLDSDPKLEPFQNIIKAHFFESFASILAEVRSWLSDDTLRLGRIEAKNEVNINNNQTISNNTGNQEEQNDENASEGDVNEELYVPGYDVDHIIDELKNSISELEDLFGKVTLQQYIDNDPVSVGKNESSEVGKNESNDTDMLGEGKDLKPSGPLLGGTDALPCNKSDNRPIAEVASGSDNTESWEIVDRPPPSPGIDIDKLNLGLKQSPGNNFVQTMSERLESSRDDTSSINENIGVLENSHIRADAMDIDCHTPAQREKFPDHSRKPAAEEQPSSNKESSPDQAAGPIADQTGGATESCTNQSNGELNRDADLDSSEFRAKSFHLLKRLQKHPDAWVFHSIDPVMLGLKDYYIKIKNPMDLSTVEQKLTNGSYKSFRDFQLDVHLTFQNSMIYHVEQDPVVYNMAKMLQAQFEDDVKKLNESVHR